MRRIVKRYFVTGTPPGSASPAQLTFTDQDGKQVSEFPIAWAKAMGVKVRNPDAADTTDLSFRLVIDEDNENGYEEAVNLSNAANATTFTGYSDSDPVLAGDRMQVYWANSDVGAGTADTEVSIVLKG